MSADRSYPFDLLQVESGSTFLGYVDLGFDIKVRKKVKLVNIKCYEAHTDRGRQSKEFVEQLLRGKRLTVKVFRDRFHKWSTVLVILYAETATGQSINVNDLIVEQEFGLLVKSDASNQSD